VAGKRTDQLLTSNIDAQRRSGRQEFLQPLVNRFYA
jgi:hypothetical protein